jgi:hypothetical protein
VLGGCGKDEYINHMVLDCDFFLSVWTRVIHRPVIYYVPSIECARMPFNLVEFICSGGIFIISLSDLIVLYLGP